MWPKGSIAPPAWLPVHGDPMCDGSIGAMAPYSGVGELVCWRTDLKQAGLSANGFQSQAYGCMKKADVLAQGQ